MSTTVSNRKSDVIFLTCYILHSILMWYCTWSRNNNEEYFYIRWVLWSLWLRKSPGKYLLSQDEAVWNDEEGKEEGRYHEWLLAPLDIMIAHFMPKLSQIMQEEKGINTIKAKIEVVSHECPIEWAKCDSQD